MHQAILKPEPAGLNLKKTTSQSLKYHGCQVYYASWSREYLSWFFLVTVCFLHTKQRIKSTSNWLAEHINNIQLIYWSLYSFKHIYNYGNKTVHTRSTTSGRKHKKSRRIGRIYTTCKMSLKNTKNWWVLVHTTFTFLVFYDQNIQMKLCQ